MTYRYPILVSSSFGLLHGFGFASVLMDVGLPEHDKGIALLGFNLGVEIGQILFITALLIARYLIMAITKNSLQDFFKPNGLQKKFTLYFDNLRCWKSVCLLDV